MAFLDDFSRMPGENVIIVIDKNTIPDGENGDINVYHNQDLITPEKREQLFELLKTIEYDGVDKRSFMDIAEDFLLSKEDAYTIRLIYNPETGQGGYWTLYLLENISFNQLCADGNRKLTPDIAIKDNPDLIEFIDSYFVE